MIAVPVDAEALRRASLLYRRPELYDAFSTPDTPTVSALVAAHRTVAPTTVLDVGCGTGALLADLPAGYTERVGIDLQPEMVASGRLRRPGLDLRVADMREFRLGRTFDAIVCVGLCLAYAHTREDLVATLTTLAVHAAPDAVIVIQTLTDPIVEGAGTTVTVRGIEASSRYEWRDPFVVLRRRWRFADGTTAEDELVRRVWRVGELGDALARAGLVPMDGRDGHLVCLPYAVGS